MAVTLSGDGASLRDVPGVHDLRHEGDGRVVFDVDAERIDDVVRRLAALGVRQLTSQPPTLEQLFLRHYEQEPRR